MRTFIWGLLALLFVYGCSKDTDLTTDSIAHTDPMPSEEINDFIYKSLDKGTIFNWKEAPDHLLWSAAMQSDSIFAVGYQTSTTSDLRNTIHKIDINSSEWLDARDQILNIVLEGERVFNNEMTVEDLLPKGYPQTVPSMELKITNPETIKVLRNLNEIRYLEAMGYELPPIADNSNSVLRSSSGCGSDPNYNLNSTDYTTISPLVKQPWNHSSSNISQAWNSSNGNGVTLTIIDTGISDNQDNLGSNFNSGYSSGRTVEKYSTLYSGSWWWRSLDPPHDQCGHGTQMAGLSTAPRGNDGNAVGIAYNADLIGIRAVEDVIISSSDEKKGVKDAMILAANRSDVKVISMSLGTPFWSGTVADGIYYAYNSGKMIFAAAGTSFSWTSGVGVIFPATMSQTYAVTGVRDSYPLVKCNTCHQGSAVDFVMMMQRAANTDRTGLSLALYADQPLYVGGSSCATASVAGIAALVFGNHPGATRSDVYNAMKVNASYYPNKHNNLGWGIIDAAAAVSY